MNTRNSQLLDFGVLVVLLLAGLSGFLGFSHLPDRQVLVIGLTSVGYVVWGIWHHVRWGNYYWQVALEYVLVALLVTVLAWSLLA